MTTHEVIAASTSENHWRLILFTFKWKILRQETYQREFGSLQRLGSRALRKPKAALLSPDVHLSLHRDLFRRTQNAARTSLRSRRSPWSNFHPSGGKVEGKEGRKLRGLDPSEVSFPWAFKTRKKIPMKLSQSVILEDLLSKIIVLLWFRRALNIRDSVFSAHTWKKSFGSFSLIANWGLTTAHSGEKLRWKLSIRKTYFSWND